MSLLVLPSLRVQGCNMITSGIAIGGPPVTAAYLFAHALCLKAGLGVEPTGMAFVHHDITPLGQGEGRVFYPQQRRAAAFTFTNRADADYSSTNRSALSLQPSASAHLRLSLVVETDGPVADTACVEAFLETARFAGGRVVGHRPVAAAAGLDEAFAHPDLRGGHLVRDRRDLICPDADPAEQLVSALAADGDGDAGDRTLSATTVGYATLTGYHARIGVREADRGYPHAYAEPLVGLVQFCPLSGSDAAPGPDALWRAHWLGDEVFLLQQQPPAGKAA